MNDNKHFRIIIVLLLAIMVIPQIGFSQTNNNQVTAAFAFGESWMPVNEFKNPESNPQINSKVDAVQPLTNVLNGVSLYMKNAECNSVKIALLKLINTNNYPIKVSWKMSPTSPVSFVEVPARYTLEGACSKSKGVETTKLVIERPTGTKTERTKTKRYILSSLTIAPVNN